MQMPSRKYSAAGEYRYGFNGKEKDKDMNSLTAYDYGFRIYNPGIGKFLSVDPLTQSYPWYTPYQFAGNMPIISIDLDGLEESVTQPNTAINPTIGTKDNPVKLEIATVVAKAKHKIEYNQTLKTYFEYTRDANGAWIRGTKTEYDYGITNKNLYSDPDFDLDNLPHQGDDNIYAHMGNSWFMETQALGHLMAAFSLGTSGNIWETNGDARELLDNFLFGERKSLNFYPGSEMSQIIGSNPHFLAFAQKFEGMAKEYFIKHKSLNGFDGNKIIETIRPEYLGFPSIYSHVVMGGYYAIQAKISRITASEIQVHYTISDHFGAGLHDSKSKLPGLAAMYFLQHYRSATNKSRWSDKYSYQPFIWDVSIIR
jgi:RHS repeat-associated protein